MAQKDISQITRELEDLLVQQPKAEAGWREAQKVQPEAQKEQPEARKEQPEAQEVQPEARKEQPEAQKVQPEAQKEQPEAQKEQPEAQKEQPEAQKEQPEARKEQPEAQKEQPETQKVQPEAQEEQREARKEWREAQEGQPETQKGQREAQEGQPETQKGQPEIQERQPEEKGEAMKAPETNMETENVKKKGKGRHALQGQAWNLVRPSDGLIAAFMVPVVILLIIFAQRGIFPFGEESFLRTDMYHQYAPFFSEFRNKLATGESLLYSWNVGMGVNFSALYAYYLASPLNWFLLLCPAGLVIEFMTYMIVLKTGLSGLSMVYYLRKHCKTTDFGTVFFAIFYALSGYMAAYSWNIMWLDCIILFPLALLGLERLVREGKGLPYCIILGLSILSNYYISIMTCVFLVLYFVALMVLERHMTWEKFINRSFWFAVYSLLAGGLAACVLLPEIYALQMTASGEINFPKSYSQYFPIIDMAARHINNVETEIGLDHWPNIYCGVAVLMLFPLYLSSKKVPGKEKAIYCLMLLFFFASFSINVMNFVWHGFHYPNSLPCRQSYIYICFMLLMCCKAYLGLKEAPWKHVVLAFWGSVGFVLLAQKLVTAKHFDNFIIFYVAILFLALYLAAFWLYQKGPVYRNRALLFALAVVSVEAAVNMTVTSITTTSRTAYKNDNGAVGVLVSSVLPARNGDTFFRMEKVSRKTKNDGAWMNFPSVSLFSSTANADLSKLFKKLGCESSTNAYSITGSTPLIDCLFAVKYGLYSEAPDDTAMREFMAQEEDILLYRNRYTLPLGFWVPENFESLWNLDAGNPADVQNSLADGMGTGPVLDAVLDATAEGKTMTFWPEASGEYYAYVGNKKIEKVTAATWKGTKTFNNVNRGYLLELGYCIAGEEVTLTAEDTEENMWADVYRFSETGLEQAYNKLSACPWKLTRWQEALLEGTVSCEEKGIMMTTIPYDKGWTILVDGLEVPAVKMLDAFIGVPLTEGRHSVFMKYSPPGLKAGWLATFGSLALLSAIQVSICLLKRHRGRKGRQDEGWEAWDEEREAWDEEREAWGEEREAWGDEKESRDEGKEEWDVY